MSHAYLIVAIDPTDDIEDAVAHQMQPFDENRDDFSDEEGGWFANGTRWDWWVIGGRYSGRLMGKDIIARSELDLDQIIRDNRERATGWWHEAQKQSAQIRALVYGINPEDTLESYLNRQGSGLSAYAFLRNRVWQEKERLGWFALATATECEREGKEAHICKFEDPKTGSRIVSWGGSESWGKMYYPRFIEPLPPETLLVSVDYHV